MDAAVQIIILVLGFVAMYSVHKWNVWQARYEELAGKSDRLVAHYNKTMTEVSGLLTQYRHNRDTMMEVFDFLNENQPFASHSEGLAQCRNRLLHAIQNSTDVDNLRESQDAKTS